MCQVVKHNRAKERQSNAALRAGAGLQFVVWELLGKFPHSFVQVGLCL